jgi:deoxyribodipyrimidine photolyase-like uncharacterized protein
VDSVLVHYRANHEEISISQVEGFIRQVIGWREYMRGMYWAQMPEYKTLNTLDNHHAIPDFFWSGDTKMNCLSKTINNSLDNAYAHHIQRLMITGNYLLLTQTHPDEVDDWYLGIYIDALEWVQLPNTRGMSQFADGGLIAIVEDGDTILIDAENDQLLLKVSEAEITQRLSRWINLAKIPEKGVLSKFAKSVKSASLGAVTD